MDDLISRQAAIDALERKKDKNAKGEIGGFYNAIIQQDIETVMELPSAQPEYEPVTAEDFAKTMSEHTVYRYMAWHGEALALMKEQGFVICKKAM